jgi:hypothetical protein
MRNAAAIIVAIICWTGLAVQFSATYAVQQDITATLSVLTRFFTVLTNLLAAVVMTLVALRRRVSAFLLGGATLAILLVGGVYMLLLQGLVELSGGAILADTLLHKVSPIAMSLWWLLFAPRKALKWSAPLWWSVYPLAYFAYALSRAQLDGRYPYPFMDIGKIGWVQTVVNAGGIAMIFVLAGLCLVWLDRWLPLGSKRSTR